jgi:hypothetical protein
MRLQEMGPGLMSQLCSRGDEGNGGSSGGVQVTRLGGHSCGAVPPRIARDAGAPGARPPQHGPAVPDTMPVTAAGPVQPDFMRSATDAVRQSWPLRAHSA